MSEVIIIFFTIIILSMILFLGVRSKGSLMRDLETMQEKINNDNELCKAAHKKIKVWSEMARHYPPDGIARYVKCKYCGKVKVVRA